MSTNGGFYSYPDRTQQKIFFRAGDRYTQSGVLKKGQVLKARTFLESDVDGKWIAHTGTGGTSATTETVTIKFKDAAAAVTAADSQIIVDGITVDAVVGTTPTGAAWATAFLALFTNRNIAINDTAFVGSSSGTPNYTAVQGATADELLLSSVTPGNQPDLTVTTTVVDAPVVTVNQGANAAAGTGVPNKIAGVLCFDVDATTADTDCEAYIEASFWADAIVWKNDVAKDTITLFDGTKKAVTAYDTGVYGDKLLQQKFVEGSEFAELGFLHDGEKA